VFRWVGGLLGVCVCVVGCVCGSESVGVFVHSNLTFDLSPLKSVLSRLLY
jgi:hypothetical protein